MTTSHYDIDGVKIIKANLDDVAQACQRALDNDKKRASSNGSADTWHGHYTLKGYRDVMRDGDSKLVSDIIGDLDLQIADNAERMMLRREPAGFYPCVPAHLSGDPNSMFAMHTEESPDRKAITIFYNVGYAAGTSESAIRSYGESVMRIVNQLHAERVDVAVYGYIWCSYRPENFTEDAVNTLSVLEIQRSEDLFQPERFAVTLSPAFFRRGIFALWETMADDGCKPAKQLVSQSYGAHTSKLELSVLKASLSTLDTDSIVLLPEASYNINPSELWEPINLKLGRST